MTDGETIKDLREKVNALEGEFQEAVASKDRHKIGSLSSRLFSARRKLAANEAADDVTRQQQKKKIFKVHVTVSTDMEQLKKLLKEIFSKEV